MNAQCTEEKMHIVSYNGAPVAGRCTLFGANNAMNERRLAHYATVRDAYDSWAHYLSVNHWTVTSVPTT